MAEKYQSFFNQEGSSDSFAKLKQLGLPTLHGKSFLDVGCNEGFFCAVALHAGADRIVGIDTHKEFIGRARKRFPSIDFRSQTWDKPIEGRYDVILLASAIHYAQDQPGLIRKLVNLLAPRGVLVLELGIVDAPGDQYVDVKRQAGDIRSYATFAALERILGDCAYRVIGRSVTQSGDPVPRWVVHITKRKPTILFFDAPSYYGKSSAVQMLAKGSGASGDTPCVVGIDGIFRDINEDLVAEFPKHAEVLKQIAEFKREKSIFANVLMEMLGGSSLIEKFIDFVIEFRIQNSLMIVWDGFIPEKYRYQFRSHFFSKGFIVWAADPFGDLSYERINPNELVMSLPQGMAFRSIHRLRCHLDTAVWIDENLRLIGWAADIGKHQPVNQFMLFLGDNSLDATMSIKQVMRSGANEEIGWDDTIMLGFEIDVPKEEISQHVTTEMTFLSMAGKGDVVKQMAGIRLFALDDDGGVIEATYSGKFPLLTK